MKKIQMSPQTKDTLSFLRKSVYAVLACGVGLTLLVDGIAVEHAMVQKAFGIETIHRIYPMNKAETETKE